jgi:hypothetical protein
MSHLSSYELTRICLYTLLSVRLTVSEAIPWQTAVDDDSHATRSLNPSFHFTSFPWKLQI